MSKKKIDLLIIDPQRSFVDPTLNELFVPCSEASVTRLADFVDSKGKWLNDIDITLDSHHQFHIGHPLYWKDDRGQEPPPFTPISSADVKNNVWTSRVPSLRNYTIGYLEALEKRGRYGHMVWPPHCLIGTPGHTVAPALMAALLRWESSQVAWVGKHSKGSCPYTEHFSGVMAEVPHPEDPSTALNIRLVEKLQQADQLLIAGWATSHCVANTIRDVATAFGTTDHVKKFVLLEDCTDSVTGCEHLTKGFIAEFSKLGMKVAKSTDVL
jgi:nicotinamidase/pyrazinamidase